MSAQEPDPGMAVNPRPLTNVVYPSTPERIERGRELVEGPLHCYSCHSPRDEGGQRSESMHLGGRVLVSNDQWTLVAPNLTPDKETGAGNWTDDMFARAIREGVGHDGRYLVNGMPFRNYQRLSDEDLQSVVVYLRSLKPVRNELPKRKLRPFDLISFKDRPNLYKGVVPHPDPDDLVGLGKYMVELSNCASCHTTGGRNFAGGRIYEAQSESPIVSANISSDPTGIGSLTPEAFTYILRTGKGGTLSNHMPWERYKDLPDDELAAMLAYLKTSKPVSHHVVNTGPATFCGVCGQKHGLGELNEYVALEPFDPNYVVPWNIAGEYGAGRSLHIIEKVEGQFMMSARRQVKTPFVPISETEFQVHGDDAIYTFELDDANKVLAMHWQNEENGNRLERAPERQPIVAFDPDYTFPWDVGGLYKPENGRNTITISNENGQWRFMDRMRGLLPLVPVSETEFRVEGNDPVFAFEVDDASKVNAVIVKTNGREFRLPRVAE